MDDGDDLQLRARIRVMQIVAGALIFGLATFLALAILLAGRLAARGGVGKIAGVPILTFVAIAMLVVETPAAVVVSQSMMNAGLRNIASGRNIDGQPLAQARSDALLGLAQSIMIVRMALFEGAGFMACIAHIVDAHMAALGVAGVCLAILLAHFPTEGGIRSWLEQAERRMEELQRM